MHGEQVFPEKDHQKTIKEEIWQIKLENNIYQI